MEADEEWRSDCRLEEIDGQEKGKEAVTIEATIGSAVGKRN